MPRAWTTAQPQPCSKKSEDPVTVLATGFGFLEKYPKNSSWEVASTLPALLPSTPDHPTPVHIHVHHEPIRVAYYSVLDLVPRLLSPQNPMTPTPDIILHIGLAAGRDFFTLEQGAHRRGYGEIPDVDGEKFVDEVADERFPPAIYPPLLQTCFDTETALKRWKDNLGYSAFSSRPEEGKPDVRLSPDAGNFLCGFIYYNSLAHYYTLNENERPVAFLHVPDLSDGKGKLDVGRRVAIGLIRALVVAKKERGIGNRVTKVARVGDSKSLVAETDVNFT
ncbi:pyroglutamyl peptidase-like protein type I [Lojkania enalia]|uniref:Pyroglutamyl peptidase-like protein type I n=1 Tax=Lojkania enalia TaxID=147567 RepID=A0A9P4JWI8_9PLEO|nr:pyroglutamyl peptidase-like protein type I [Didymosphaeria enalia]